jgi:hypothetical protein
VVAGREAVRICELSARAEGEVTRD